MQTSSAPPTPAVPSVPSVTPGIRAPVAPSAVPVALADSLTPVATGILTYFADMPDPRSDHARRHILLDVVTIAICAIICGANDWVEVAYFGECKKTWFGSFLELPHGIPSHDTFTRIFRLLSPEAFEKSFRLWTSAIATATQGRLIGLDGKTVRHSHDRTLGASAIHMVSAWAKDGHLVLGQTKVAAKSNEITAIPQLLQLLDVSGSIVTIDAMGTQRDIARTIIKQGADYMLAVKQNQPHLYADVTALFAKLPLPAHSFTVTKDHGHGRTEIRYASVLTGTKYLKKIRNHTAWKKLTSIVRITDARQVGEASRVTSERFFLSSRSGDAKEALEAVRGHWGIENSQHWILDVAFREDECRIRKGHGAENFAVLRRIALNLLKSDTEVKAGIKTKRHVAGWNEDYLLGLLIGSGVKG